MFKEDKKSRMLVQCFVKYLIENDLIHYLNEIVKKKIIVNGEERYLILKLERVKEHLFELFNIKMKSIDDDFIHMPIEQLIKLQQILFRIIQVFQGLISNIDIYINITKILYFLLNRSKIR